MSGDTRSLDFEKALAELESLVERLERGVALTRHCQAALQAAQQKVEILLKRGGQPEVQPFEEPGADGAAGVDGE